jgi:hypothetical protein
MISASRLVEEACIDLGINLADLVALASVWASLVTGRAGAGESRTRGPSSEE